MATTDGSFCVEYLCIYKFIKCNIELFKVYLVKFLC
jgi:hypothetical protein